MSRPEDETLLRAMRIPWRDIVGMRNRLAHGYGSVDHDILWTVATLDMPNLVRQLEMALDG